MSTGTKLSTGVISIFILMAASFIIFQHIREKEFKIELLKDKLKDYNTSLNDHIIATQDTTFTHIEDYIHHHTLLNLRATIISKSGDVLYDNLFKDYKSMSNHLLRDEIIEALKNGEGADIDRRSSTLGHEYFYVASYFPQQEYIIRTSLPYDQELIQTLTADMRFLWLTLAIAVLLSIVLYRFTHQLGSNITKLRTFATLAGNGSTLNKDDLPQFSNDELGEIADRITKLYIQLHNTKQEQNILKRQLTENATHELKTPVATIQGCLETILADPTMSEEVRTQFLQRSFRQSQRLTSLLNDISTLHRLDDAPNSYSFDIIDLNSLVKQIINETEQEVAAKDMTIRDHPPQQLLLGGNFSLLYSIFRNLTDNAIAYAGSGTTITISAYHQSPYWHFTFSDNGIGIPQEHQPRIFERFYRVDKGRSRKSGGTGLGLAVVKNAVIAHGGNIRVDTPDEGGTSFTFTLRDDIEKQ